MFKLLCADAKVGKKHRPAIVAAKKFFENFILCSRKKRSPLSMVFALGPRFKLQKTIQEINSF